MFGLRFPRSNALPLSVLAATLVLVALIGPYISPYNPTALGRSGSELQAPSLAHPFGTDQVGRDLFSRVLSGARISLGVAAAVVVIAFLIGTALGLLAGLGGRHIDELVMRLTDMFFAFPYMILAMA